MPVATTRTPEPTRRSTRISSRGRSRTKSPAPLSFSEAPSRKSSSKPKKKGGKSITPKDFLCAGMCAVYSFFGVTLAIAPSFFWGPKSVFCYWEVMDESGVWFGRALGMLMTAVTSSPYWAGMDKKVLSKVYLPVNVFFMLLFLQASFVLEKTGPVEGQNLLPFNMWWTQLPIAALFLFKNVQAVL